jgi:hypothetical protein
MRFLVALLTLAYGCSCFGGTIDPGVGDEKYREYGAKFECVVKLDGICDCDERPEKHYFYASAVVIDPHWVLTAAHVVEDAHDVKITVNGKERKISRIVVHQDFKKDKIGFNDVAMGYSEEDLGLDFYPDLYEKNDEVFKVAGICGFGITGDFNTGAVKVDDLKRAGSNVIDSVERTVLVCSASGGRKTSLEYLIAVGDSGGGLFIDGKLAGINSFVMAVDGKSNSSLKDQSCHTRVSLFKDWIRDEMRRK